MSDEDMFRDPSTGRFIGRTAQSRVSRAAERLFGEQPEQPVTDEEFNETLRTRARRPQRAVDIGTYNKPGR